jgi:hypothetical protein
MVNSEWRSGESAAMNGVNAKMRRLAAMTVFCLASCWSARVVGQEPTEAESRGKRKELRWAPPDVETALPAVSRIAPCVLSTVLERVGVRASEFAATLEKFTAQEEIQYEKFGQDGALEESDSSVFDYTFGFEQRGAGRGSQEYRTPTKGGHAFPASNQDTGQAALALIFLPAIRTDYEMRCEGVDNSNGKSAYVIHFEQRKDKAARTLVFAGERGVYPVMLRGRAWISAENNQVLHLEANTMDAIRVYKVRNSTIAVDYGPVQIHSQSINLWLPKSIEAYWEYQNYRVILMHTFTNFRVFSVETEEKVKLPNLP